MAMFPTQLKADEDANKFKVYLKEHDEALNFYNNTGMHFKKDQIEEDKWALYQGQSNHQSKHLVLLQPSPRF